MAQQGEKGREKRFLVLIIILIVITVISVCVTVWAVWFREPKAGLAPDFAFLDEEKNAQDIESDKGGGKLEQADGGGAVSLIWSDKVYVDCENDTVELLFGNPSVSNQDTVIQIVIQDTVIAYTGRIEPGKQVVNLDLNDEIKDLLSEGTYKGSFIISYYDGDSGEKAVLNSEIPVTVYVRGCE